jgi:ribosome biogenesis GTPase
VIREDRARCLVDAGDGTIHAGYAGPLDPPPTTGDWVLLGPDGRIAVTLPRRTAFRRGSGRPGAREQVLAANVDVVGVVHGLSAPPNLGRLERLVALAWSSGAQPVVVLTKADLTENALAEREETQAACPGAEVVCVSTEAGHWARAGLGELRALIAPGSTGAFIGPSGAGKSTLVNAMAGAERLATAGIRADGKGRHTSVTRELVILPWGAVVIDTPGLRGVQLWDAEDGLDAAFADITALADDCRFGDCQHRTEPGCAVRAAIESGALTARRLDSWERLQREQTWLASRYDARLRAEQRQKWKALTKAVRKGYRP